MALSRPFSFQAAVALFAAAALIALAVSTGWTARFDQTLLLALAAGPALVSAIEAMTWFGDSLTRAIIASIVVIMLIARRERWQALWLTVAAAGGAALNSGIKAIVSRPRPDLLPHLDYVTTSSFPSGHSANSAILYLLLAALAPLRFRKVAAAAALFLILAVGLSRIALAVHWPSDVLAGWCVGGGWALLWWHRLTGARMVDP